MAEPSLAAYLPFGHAMQAATFDAVEYLPTAHPVQILAPVLVPAFVSEPAPQSVHAKSVGIAEYVPSVHAVHAFAPVNGPVFVIDPAEHTIQLALPG